MLILLLTMAWANPAVEAPVVIHLPEEVARFSDLRFHKDHLFIVSQTDNIIYKVNRTTGDLVASYDRVGQGPGEWKSPFDIRFANNLVYVSDTLQRKIIVLDTDLNFVREMKGLSADMFVILNNNFFAVDYDPATHSMIHQVEMDLTPIRHFGEPLKPETNYYVVQLGLIAVVDELICYMPYARFELNVFSPSGEKLESITPPFMDPDFTKDCNLKNRNWSSECPFPRISRLQSDGQGNLYISVYSKKSHRAISMRYHLKNRTWEGGFPNNWQLDTNTGQVYLLEENEDGAYSLKPYTGVFRKYPG